MRNLNRYPGWSAIDTEGGVGEGGFWLNGLAGFLLKLDNAESNMEVGLVGKVRGAWAV